MKTPPPKPTRVPNALIINPVASRSKYSMMITQQTRGSLLRLCWGTLGGLLPRSRSQICDGGQQIANAHVRVQIKESAIDAGKISGGDDVMFPSQNDSDRHAAKPIDRS